MSRSGRRVPVVATLVLLGACGGPDGPGATAPDVPTNREPVARFSLETSGTSLPVGASVDASASTDADGRITAYRWEFGDGTTATEAQATHVYESAGTFTLRLTVTDDLGATGSATGTLMVAPPAADAITGITWFDRNHDGARQADEEGFPGIPVFLDDDGDGVVDSGERAVTSGVGGVYRFDGLPAGTYRVTQALPLGWTNTAPGPAATPAPGPLRIIAGEEAPAGAYPFMVSLQIARVADRHAAHICGGSLIAPGWILTAAHCVSDDVARPVDPGDLEILVGTQKLDGSGERVPVERVVVNPGYSPAGGFYKQDLAVLKLARRFESTPRAFLMDSTDFARTVRPSATGTVIGWGLIQETATGIPVALQSARLPYRAPGDCVDAWGADRFEDSMLCVGFIAGTPDTCSGDSGGPWFFLLRGAPYQTGVVSWGPRPCGRPNAPSVFASIPAMRGFVVANVPGEPSGSRVVTLAGPSQRVDFGNFH